MLKIFSLFIAFFALSFFELQAQHSTSQSLEQMLAPLIAKSKARGDKGLIDPDEIYVSPSLWALNCNEKSQGRIIDRMRLKIISQPDACRFLSAVKQVIEGAVCEENRKELVKLWHLTRHYRGYFLSERQALYLDQLANSLKMEQAYFDHIKLHQKIGVDQSFSPQAVRRFRALLTKVTLEKARAEIPAFHTLCPAGKKK